MSNSKEKEYDLDNEILINSHISINDYNKYIHNLEFSQINKKNRIDHIKNWTFNSKKSNLNYNMTKSNLKNEKEYENESKSENIYNPCKLDSSGKK
jgi:hypothetical protein